jgi:hypothetical protein
MASRGARKPPVLLLAALLLLSCLAPAFCDGASTAGSGVGLHTNRKLHTGGRALTGAWRPHTTVAQHSTCLCRPCVHRGCVATHAMHHCNSHRHNPLPPSSRPQHTNNTATPPPKPPPPSPPFKKPPPPSKPPVRACVFCLSRGRGNPGPSSSSWRSASSARALIVSALAALPRYCGYTCPNSRHLRRHHRYAGKPCSQRRAFLCFAPAPCS